MKRRGFIAILGLGSLSALGSFVLFRFEQVNLKILKKSLGELYNYDIAEKFILEATKEALWEKFSVSKKVIFMIHYYLNSPRFISYKYEYLEYTSYLTGFYLLSTNYFSSFEQEKKLIYTGFFNPYKSVCANPFSDLKYK